MFKDQTLNFIPPNDGINLIDGSENDVKQSIVMGEPNIHFHFTFNSNLLAIKLFFVIIFQQ